MRTTSGKDWCWEPTRQAIYHRDGFRCIACKRKPKRTKSGPCRKSSLSLDHVVPGAGNAPTNLVTLCVSCNSSKQKTPLHLWRPELADTIATALAKPLDRAAGRAITMKIRPSRLAQHAFATSAKEAKRRTEEREKALGEFFRGFGEFVAEDHRRAPIESYYTDNDAWGGHFEGEVA